MRINLTEKFWATFFLIQREIYYADATTLKMWYTAQIVSAKSIKLLELSYFWLAKLINLREVAELFKPLCVSWAAVK